MIINQQIQSEVLAYLLTGLLLFTIMIKYGRQVMLWMLMKLYDFLF